MQHHFQMSLFGCAKSLNEGLFHVDSVILARAVEESYRTGHLHAAVSGRYGIVLINAILYWPFYLRGQNADFLTRFSSVFFYALSIPAFFIFINIHKTMNKIEKGSNVPGFTLPDQDGKLFDISTVLGTKNLVIYFYPKDDTPGCTKEACYFRDQFEVFKEEDAIIIGISGQSVESHKEFATKYKLNYTLLSDEGNEIRKLFGVPTNLFGFIPGRVTYIVNKKGKVVYTFNSQSQATKHVDEALRILKQLK